MQVLKNHKLPKRPGKRNTAPHRSSLSQLTEVATGEHRWLGLIKKAEFQIMKAEFQIMQPVVKVSTHFALSKAPARSQTKFVPLPFMRVSSLVVGSQNRHASAASSELHCGALRG